ncbi:MAG: alpha/beta hydrolase-fold protein [Polyangiaceae bacterium]
MTVSRRAFVLGALVAGCSRPKPAPRATVAPPPTLPIDASTRGNTMLLEWTMGTPEERVVVVVPDPPEEGKAYRVVVALHGRGEAVKPPAEGAMGWPRDYALTRAIDRISNPPLVRDDFEGLVEDGHLESMNQALAEKPFGGLVVVCPRLPDLDPYDSSKVAAYGQYLVEDVLGRVRRELPVDAVRAKTGIDGVSLGGIVALEVGLAHADVFGAVGALQPAVRPDKIAMLTSLARASKNDLPKLRLTTSHDDYFRAAIAELTATWDAAGITHDFSDLPGPHDYVFNRGPGALELLFWQDRALG